MHVSKCYFSKYCLKQHISILFSSYKMSRISNYGPDEGTLPSSKLVNLPVSIAEWSKACTVYDSLNIEIAGSNPAQGLDVCLCVSVLCCPVFQ
jgi:hypothetical protein